MANIGAGSGGMSAGATVQSCPVEQRIAMLDWPRIEADLAERGVATAASLLTAAECAALRRLYAAGSGFRKHVIMARQAYGSGEYRYFAYPLPELVQALRTGLYARLAGPANLWAERLDKGLAFPPELAEFTRECHSAGQKRPTPLILRYGAGDYNRLHQDLYGERFFPFQAAILLNRPGEDFSGGEFVLVENRPRVQSRARVVPLNLGDMVIFAVNERADRGRYGYRRASLRHGISDVRDGERHTLGIIFHDAS